MYRGGVTFIDVGGGSWLDWSLLKKWRRLKIVSNGLACRSAQVAPRWHDLAMSGRANRSPTISHFYTKVGIISQQRLQLYTRNFNKFQNEFSILFESCSGPILDKFMRCVQSYLK